MNDKKKRKAAFIQLLPPFVGLRPDRFSSLSLSLSFHSIHCHLFRAAYCTAALAISRLSHPHPSLALHRFLHLIARSPCFLSAPFLTVFPSPPRSRSFCWRAAKKKLFHIDAALNTATTFSFFSILSIFGMVQTTGAELPAGARK